MRKSRRAFWLVIFSGGCLAQSASAPAAESLQALLGRAAKGDAMAGRTLGVMYRDGKVVHQDYAEIGRASCRERV